MDYKEAGVNIEEGYKAVSKYGEAIKLTSNGAVLGKVGSFGGLFNLKDIIEGAGQLPPLEEPVLVSGTDGVGTKLDIAFRLEKYNTVGIDCVAMCVNDILCHGARPLFFLDYLACGKLDADVAAEIVTGVAAGCRETGAVLLGGETAEMPGFYENGKYDIAGFAVGIVDRKKIIDGSKIREEDIILGVASSGVHSNGFSLIRKVITDLSEDFGGMPIGHALLEPTRLYVKPILELLKKVDIHGMANITGGGFYENIPRMFNSPALYSAVINDPLASKNESGWQIPPIFFRIAYGIKNSEVISASSGGAEKTGEEILRSDPEIKKIMFNTFNMGIGFVLALDPGDVKEAAAFLEQCGFPAWVIGKVEESKAGGIRFA